MENVTKIRKKYVNLYQVEGIDSSQLDIIKETLNVELPNDFCEVSKFYSGGYLGGISNYSFFQTNDCENIIDETLRLRNAINLPERFIILAEPPESLIVLDTQNEPSIIWCDAVEVNKLCDNDFISPPDVWRNYSDYFIQLVEDEEEENN